MAKQPRTTAAQIFLDRFPGANPRTGWSNENLHTLSEYARTRQITLQEFDDLCVRLLKSDARRALSVATFIEVTNEIDRMVANRTPLALDGALQRLDEIKAEYKPPTEQQRAERKAWLERFRSGKEASHA